MSVLDRRTFAVARAELKRATAPVQPPQAWAAGNGIHLWSRQRDIAASVQASRRTAVAAGHAVGKSYLAAVLTAWWAQTRPGGMVITTAPTRDQVHGILWEEIRDLHQRLSLPGRALDNDTWKIGTRLAAWGRKPPDRAAGSDFDPSTFQGFHRSAGVLMILDEAGGIPEWLWTAAETVTTETASRILAIGNPDNPGSHFAKVCSPGYPGWSQFQISVFDSPNFTGEPVPPHVAAALVGPGWEAERLAEWGADDPRYISKVLARFPSDHPMQVVSIADLIGCQFAEPRAESELVPVELGVDVGGGGDWTTIRERRGVRAGRSWRQLTPDPATAARLVLMAIRETGAVSVKVDATGIGWGLVGELRNAGARGEHGAKVHAVMVGQAASDPLKFVNLRAELWWSVGRESSQQRTWDLSSMEDADKAVADLVLPRWQLDPKGRILIEPKDKIRERTGGRSPDDGDALLLCYYVPRSGASDYWAALAAGKVRA